MARIRTIKPEYFKNEQIAELPAMTRLLFIGLWTQADRAGRLEDRPKRIKAEIFPYDNIDIEKALNDLQSKGFIFRYKGNVNISDRVLPPEQPITELNCIQIVNFNKHQRIDRLNENESQLPEFQIIAPIDYKNTIDSLPIVQEGKGREGKGKETSLPQAAEKKTDWKPTEKEIESYQKFMAWLEENAPSVAKMEKKITIEQLFKLRGLLPNSTGGRYQISKQQVTEYILAIENNREYLKKYRSPYLCILAWHKRNQK